MSTISFHHEFQKFDILWLIVIAIEILVALNVYIKSRKDGRGVSVLRKILTTLPFILFAVFLYNLFIDRFTVSASITIMFVISFLFHMTSNVELRHRDSPDKLFKTFLFNLAVSISLVVVSYLFEVVPAGMFIATKSSNILERGIMWLFPPIMLNYALYDIGSLVDEESESIQYKIDHNIYKMLGAHILSFLPFALYLNSGEITVGMLVHKGQVTLSPYFMSYTNILAGLSFFAINAYLYYQIIKSDIKINRTALIGAILLSLITIEMTCQVFPNIIFAVFLARIISFALIGFYMYILKRIFRIRLIESTA